MRDERSNPILLAALHVAMLGNFGRTGCGAGSPSPEPASAEIVNERSAEMDDGARTASRRLRVGHGYYAGTGTGRKPRHAQHHVSGVRKMVPGG